MRSIGARIAVWYACAATATLAVLFAAGYVLLERHLLHGLDLLNESEFQQIEARLGPDYSTLSAPFIEMRIRETTDYASTLFYIDIHRHGTGAIFRSTNLNGADIPDVTGQRHFSVAVPGVGEVRAAEFQMAPFDVMIATPLKPVREVMDTYVEVCAALMVAMLLASLLIGFGLSRLVLRPVRIIRDTANRIRSDNLSERIPVGDVRDEIADLARLLNQMFDRLESSFEQIRRFTSDASHELKTPLSLIRLHAEKLLTDAALPAVHREGLQDLLEEVDGLNRVIEDLLFLSRADAHAIALQLETQDPQPFLQGFGQDAEALAEHHGMRFVLEHSGSGEAAFEPKWMRQVLLNLLINAIRVSPPGGLIRLRSALDEGAWRLSLEDQGPGLTEEERDRMFERFVRFAATGAEKLPGTGLGLAICRSIVGLHGGQIQACPAEAGTGLDVEIRIPAAVAA
ncbi:HAMP domain-containing sensor histidine kinase [Piscinibacter sp.]|jgi:two-component system heavy metal sensor histidine kinase CusS|uniref:HAMP domain-containing sensor histidine kinase n=1 Tax=Piscinibacter sp. TaxID=1903157 RepID=UPI002F4258A0